MALVDFLSPRKVPYFNPTCPNGGKWYACDSTSETTFIGCCTADPCGANGCAAGNLQTVSFNGSTHGTYPDATCGTGSKFYSCNGTKPAFWGCCSNSMKDACAYDDGCPKDGLMPAIMNQPNQFKAYATGTIDATPSATSSGNPSGGGEKGHSHTSVIVGCVVGGAVLIVAIIALLIYFLRRRKRLSGGEAKPIGVEVAPMEEPLGFGVSDAKYDHRGTPHTDPKSPPPTYSSPNPGTYGGYQQVPQAPQELPREGSPRPPQNAAQRYSELPVDGETMRIELESPEPSPRPDQANFSSPGRQGAGLGLA